MPVALQDGFIQIAFLVITIIANRRGLNQAAAVGIVEKIISFLFLVPSSMLSSVSALAAQNIGAGKHDRARETLHYALLIAGGFWPKGAQALREILLPGDSAVTAAAWAELTHELHAGAPVGSVVENFCREVFANAGLCPG